MHNPTILPKNSTTLAVREQVPEKNETQMSWKSLAVKSVIQ